MAMAFAVPICMAMAFAVSICMVVPTDIHVSIYVSIFKTTSATMGMGRWQLQRWVWEVLGI